MLGTPHRWREWVVGLSAAMLILLIVGSSQSFQTCIEQSQKQTSSQALEKGASYLFALFGRYEGCVGVFIHENETAITALATIAIAAFTYTLWWSTRGMLQITDKTVRLAREEYIASHRPRLRIRNVVIDQPQSVDGRRWPLFQQGQLIRGQFFIANIGESRADILDGHCLVFWSQGGLPMRRPHEGGEDNLQAARRVLLSGESTPVLFRSTRPLADEGPTFGHDVIQGWDLYVMGWVTYTDVNEGVRRTSFCREYRFFDSNNRELGPDGRFLPVDNPDYEHEE